LQPARAGSGRARPAAADRVHEGLRPANATGKEDAGSWSNFDA
jgi:hypothetical protein